MNETTCRRIVSERSGGICEKCGKARADGKHHRLKRSRGGEWVPSNIVDLCGSGTTGCHGEIEANPDMAERSGWSVRSGVDPRTVSLRIAAWPDFRMFLDDQGGLATDGEYIPERFRPWTATDTVLAQQDEREWRSHNP